MEALSDEQIMWFNELLKISERHRSEKGKPPSSRYWVVNRDEPFAHEVKKLIEQSHGIKL